MWMPTLAIFTYELRGLLASWLVRGWMIATALVTLLLAASAWKETHPAPLIAMLLSTYLVFPWPFFVIFLGISPTTGSRLDALADGILSRPVTRFEYLAACWAARVVTVLTIFLAVMAPTIALVAFARRMVERPVTTYGAVASLAVVALVLTFLVTLSFLAGTALRRPLSAVALVVFIWFPINGVLHAFALKEFSPISLSQSMRVLLRTPWSQRDAVEANDQVPADLEALARQGNQFLSILSGQAPQPEPKDNFFERGDYEDFSLWRVGLGYGFPTFAALLLSVAFFCWRDL